MTTVATTALYSGTINAELTECAVSFRKSAWTESRTAATAKSFVRGAKVLTFTWEGDDDVR